jgi:hypothetical protein
VLTVVFSVALIGAVMLGMAVGVIFSNRRLRGSCGGSGEQCGCSEGERDACATPSSN